MTYLHDVFISYRRERYAWTPWTRDHFKPLMESYLQQELPNEPDIFLDERIDLGADWPSEIASHLARSKVMVALFSAGYFCSPWCLHELDLMLGRSLAVGYNCRLIIPVIVHDGELIPQEVDRRQATEFKQYHVAYINRDTPLYQDFSIAMQDLAPKIGSAIGSCPRFDPAWVNECRERFDQVYNATRTGGTVDVRNFTPKAAVAPRKPPRP